MPCRSQKRVTAPRSASSGHFAIAHRTSAGTWLKSMPETSTQVK
jgi:hypothetical protein